MGVPGWVLSSGAGGWDVWGCDRGVDAWAQALGALGLPQPWGGCAWSWGVRAEKSTQTWGSPGCLRLPERCRGVSSRLGAGARSFPATRDLLCGALRDVQRESRGATQPRGAGARGRHVPGAGLHRRVPRRRLPGGGCRAGAGGPGGERAGVGSASALTSAAPGGRRAGSGGGWRCSGASSAAQAGPAPPGMLPCARLCRGAPAGEERGRAPGTGLQPPAAPRPPVRGQPEPPARGHGPCTAFGAGQGFKNKCL